jgi:hypothetical protein
MAGDGIEPPTPNTPLLKSYFPRGKDIKNMLDHHNHYDNIALYDPVITVTGKAFFGNGSV